MKYLVRIWVIVILGLGLYSCSETNVRKPEKLIERDKFEKMLTDIYMVQGITNMNTQNAELKKISQTDLYYSVLKKYDVADTVFIRSLIYYSSFPKEYEKMQNEIMDQLNETGDQFRPKEKLNVTKE
jgi:hypothetical protein